MRDDFKNMIRAEDFKIIEIIEESENKIEFKTNKGEIVTANLDYDEDNTTGGTIKIYNNNNDLIKTIEIAGMFL